MIFSKRSYLPFLLTLFFLFGTLAYALCQPVLMESFYVVDSANRGNFLMKNDGTKIYGNFVDDSLHILKEGNIKIDSQVYKIAEIKAYQYNDYYHLRCDKKKLAPESIYLGRIIRGKINVYMMSIIMNMPGVYDYTAVFYYYQIGSEGKLKLLKSSDNIKELVKDCPEANEMMKGNIYKKIKANRYYLTKVFDTYNNCK